jgi:hypothetical protein
MEEDFVGSRSPQWAVMLEKVEGRRNMWRRRRSKKKKKKKKKKHKHVLSTIVQMLDVITSFNCNCYSPNDVLKK